MFTDKSLWQKLFGTIWQTLINTNTEIGGFLINHETKEVFVDSNSMHLMGLRKRPSYDDMLLLMDSLDEDISERKIEVIYAENSDKLAFGYCRSSVAAAETLPVCTQAKLFAAMSENSRNSILALIRLEESAILAIPFRHISAALNAIIRASINGTLILCAAMVFAGR